MSYLILNPKNKKQETLIKQFAEKLNVEFKKVSLEEYMRDIEESRQQIRNGKTISLKELELGL